MLRAAVVFLALALTGLVVAWFVGNARFRTRMAEAKAAWASIAAAPPGLAFDPAALADQPEIARRYLTHAIAPGTPLNPNVTLTMDGTFRLGDASHPREMAMTARQRLAAPGAFVWIPHLSGGGMALDGSDGFDGAHGWTRFWAFRALPLVQLAATEDLDRAALARPAVEAMWAPAALHPALGAQWVQTGPDSAEVTFPDGPEPVTISLTLSAEGAVKSVVTQRWSDANPAKRYQWQPFGGMVHAEARFGGYTIPSQIEAGNHSGTPEYFAFFDVRITGADYSAD
jgi:Family of unknown function (DUF6544)